MPAVLVHGVPDTHRVWNALIGCLHRPDVVTLSLPGFGCAIPLGFDCTKEAYCDWLLGELRRVEAPIDLVGHDWGALLVVRAVSLEPSLVRTWAAGGAPLDAEYEWHRVAPGLVLWGENDPYAGPVFGRRLASRTRARFVEFRGCSHWWQLERPAEVAKELEAFWERV